MNLLKKIPHDKLLHFQAGFLFAIVLGYYLPWFLALWAGCFAGMIKESYDTFVSGGKLETWDYLATAIGAIVATGLILLATLV